MNEPYLWSRNSFLLRRALMCIALFQWLSDERGYIYYTISIPSASKTVTTITKYNWNGLSGVPETIEWHRTRETVSQFDGKVTPASKILTKCSRNTYVDPNASARRCAIAGKH